MRLNPLLLEAFKQAKLGKLVNSLEKLPSSSECINGICGGTRRTRTNIQVKRTKYDVLSMERTREGSKFKQIYNYIYDELKDTLIFKDSFYRTSRGSIETNADCTIGQGKDLFRRQFIDIEGLGRFYAERNLSNPSASRLYTPENLRFLNNDPRSKSKYGEDMIEKIIDYVLGRKNAPTIDELRNIFKIQQ